MFDILCYFQTSTFFCSRSLFLRVPFQNALGGFQDIDWLLHASLQPGFRVIALPEILSVYHTPETRATITSTLAWDKRLAWGQINRALMSGRTYSRFIVGSCVGRAVEERGGYRALLRLLREYLFVGTPTFSGTLLFLGMWAVTPRARRRIRNAFFLSPATNA